MTALRAGAYGCQLMDVTRSLALMFAFPVAALSWRGGTWLWSGLSDGLKGRERWVGPGAILLALGTGAGAFWLASLSGSVPVQTVSRTATLLVAVSLAYNCGYLYSIAPSRLPASAWTRLAVPAALLLPAGPVLMALAGPLALPGHAPAAGWAVTGVLLTLTGLAVWERLRLQKALADGPFRTTLWRLSTGFVGISFVICIMGLAAEQAPMLHEAVHAATWLLLVSLFFYLLGLLRALPGTARQSP